MNITQKKYPTQTTFEFGDERLKYTAKDSNGSHSFSVDYWHISQDVEEFENRNSWWRNVGGIWVAIGLLAVVLRYLESGQVQGSIWVALGVICLLIYRVTSTRFSAISTDKGRILIIRNKQHDAIMQELMLRRKNHLLKLYGQVDFANDPYREIEKFKWLRTQGALSETECEDRIRSIAAHHNLALGAQPEVPAISKLN